MATETRKDGPRSGNRRYRLNVDQFVRSIEVGVFPEGPRLELLGGILVTPAIETLPNDYVVGALGEDLRKLVPAEWLVREQKALTLGRYSRPVPDLAIVRAPRSLYGRRAPTEQETALIVEVGGASYRVDRGLKWRLAASAAIPCYWIANLAGRQIEVYSDPTGRGRSASYRQASTFGPDAKVPLIIEGREFGLLAVREIFL
jgi:Uma2 family endonuclease